MLRLVFAGAVTPPDFRDFLAELLGAADRAQGAGQQLGLLVLLESLNPRYITAGMRKEHSALLQQILPRLAAVTRAEARVVRQPVLRGMLTAMSWLVPHPWPVGVFQTEEEAQQWLRGELAQPASPR